MALQVRRFLPEDRTPYGRGARDLYKVLITNGQWTIEAQMKNLFKLQLNSEWADLINGTIPGTELMKKLGNAELTTGLFSQKYFSKGGHYNMTVEFRILEDLKNIGPADVKRTSKIVEVTRNLANMSVAEKNTYDSIQEIVDKTKSNIGTGTEGVGNFVKNPSGALDNTGKLLQRKVDAALANRTVTLVIGNFFKCGGMIIKEFSVEYSKEIIKDIGPMYADFSLGMESIQAAHRGVGSFGVNSTLTNGISRVTVTDASRVNRNVNTVKTGAIKSIENTLKSGNI